ncbi:hypothetical protein QJS66_17960 [Kocuria rhizophila]|nr:hypothetical protein QJS66_17960 [Kocuria rhizophila]
MDGVAGAPREARGAVASCTRTRDPGNPFPRGGRRHVQAGERRCLGDLAPRGRGARAGGADAAPRALHHGPVRRAEQRLALAGVVGHAASAAAAGRARRERGPGGRGAAVPGRLRGGRGTASRSWSSEHRVALWEPVVAGSSCWTAPAGLAFDGPTRDPPRRPPPAPGAGHVGAGWVPTTRAPAQQHPAAPDAGNAGGARDLAVSRVQPTRREIARRRRRAGRPRGAPAPDAAVDPWTAGTRPWPPRASAWTSARAVRSP